MIEDADPPSRRISIPTTILDLVTSSVLSKRFTSPAIVLDPIYSWFTEGFDTADLKEAKALLDELS